jgi:hypothetical protein
MIKSGDKGKKYTKLETIMVRIALYRPGAGDQVALTEIILHSPRGVFDGTYLLLYITKKSHS